MAKPQQTHSISIIIPTLNESKKLPLLLADIRKWTNKLDLIIVDGGSKDLTILVAKLAGFDVIRAKEPNRGNQLRIGASLASEEWLLFLHADCRLNRKWTKEIKKVIEKRESKEYAWYFDFKLNSSKLSLKLVEKGVALRNLIFRTPYGDQGLLIHRNLYKNSGGFQSLKIMEDLDLILRLNKLTTIKRIGIPLITDCRKWKNKSIINIAIKNIKLKLLWTQGKDHNELVKSYYP